MLFGALFSAYIFLRIDAAPGTWPHGLLNVPVGTMNTAILIMSSVTVVLGVGSTKNEKVSGLLVVHAGHDFVRCDFLVVKLAYEWPQKFEHSVLTSNPMRSRSTNNIWETNDALKRGSNRESRSPVTCTARTRRNTKSR